MSLVGSKLGAWCVRRAEDVLVLLLGAMFLAFLTQIVFRYFFNLPTGWTTEVTVVTWLWMVLWGASFVLTEDEEIRLDLVQGAASPPVRRAMMGASALAILVLFAWSLPATWSYVSFMKVESTSYLKIRVDVLYSIYVVFVVAVIARQLWLLWRLFQGQDIGGGDVQEDRA